MTQVTRSYAIVIYIVIMAGCSYPNTTITTPDRRPQISVQGAPSGSKLYVDGLLMGSAHKYDGANKSLLIEPGKHKIEIKRDNETFYSQTLFLGHSENKIIKLK